MQKKNVDVERLAIYFGAQTDGEEVTWRRIEHETNIVMNPTGRALAWRALKRCKRPYVALRGVGIRLSAPDNAMEIMASRFVRIDNRVRDADKTRAILTTRHLDAMPEHDKKRMLTLAGFFGAVRAFATEAKARLLAQRSE